MVERSLIKKRRLLFVRCVRVDDTRHEDITPIVLFCI